LSRPSQYVKGLHQHSIWQVLASYGIGSWIILQVTETVSSLVGLPLWMGRAVLITLLLGLPVLLATALVKLIPGADAIATWPGKLFTWKNAMLGGLAAFIVLGVGTGAYLGMREAGIGPVGTLFATGTLEQTDPVVLAEFENTTDDATLSAAVTEIFRIDLQRSSAITLVEPEVLTDALERMGLEPDAELSGDRAQDLALREGIKAVVVGSIADVGSTLVVSVRLVAGEDGRDLIALRETAKDEEELIDAVDQLSMRLRERLGESLKDIHATAPLADVTTGSIEALRLFTRGDRAWDQGDTERALALMEEAVRVDAEFATAYRAIATILGNRFEQRARAVEAATKAYEYRDRLPVRERYLTIAYYNMRVTGDVPEAINAYRTLMELRPDDRTAVNNLGVLYSQQHDFERAEEMAVRVIEMDTRALSYQNLVVSSLQLQQLDSARVRLARFRAAYPDHSAMWSMTGQVAAAARDWEGLDAILDSTIVEFPDNVFVSQTVHNWRADIAFMRGRLREAERRIRLMEEASIQRGQPMDVVDSQARFAMAELNLLGDEQRARSRFDAAVRRFPPDSVPLVDRPNVALALYYTSIGDLERARDVQFQMEASEAFSTVPGLRTQYRFVASVVALGEGRLDEAIERLHGATEGTQCNHCNWALLGEAYDLKNEPDSAIAYYTKYLDHLNRFSGIDVSELPKALLRMAELHEERGEVGLAAEYYSRLLEMWDQVDPELQGAVRQVEQRLAGLVGEGTA